MQIRKIITTGNNTQKFVFLLFPISRVNYVHTFECICNCVNFVHVGSLSVVLICNSNKLYAKRNKQTNRKRTIKFTIVSRSRMRAFHQIIRKRSTYDFRVTCTSGTLLVTQVKNCITNYYEYNYLRAYFSQII